MDLGTWPHFCLCLGKDRMSLMSTESCTKHWYRLERNTEYLIKDKVFAGYLHLPEELEQTPEQFVAGFEHTSPAVEHSS